MTVIGTCGSGMVLILFPFRDYSVLQCYYTRVSPVKTPLHVNLGHCIAVCGVMIWIQGLWLSTVRGLPLRMLREFSRSLIKIAN